MIDPDGAPPGSDVSPSGGADDVGGAPSVVVERPVASMRWLVSIQLLLAGGSAVSPDVALMLVPGLAVPVAWARLARPRFDDVRLTIAGALLSAVVASFVLPWSGAIAVAVAIGVVSYVPGVVLAATRVGGPLELRGMFALTLCWLVLAVPVAATVFATVGVTDVRRHGQEFVRDTYDQQLRWCGDGQPLEQATAYCTGLRVDRDRISSTLGSHFSAIFWPALMVVVLAFASTSLLVLRLFAPRAGLPVQRLRPLREYRMHWTTTYVLAGGLMLLMASRPAAGTAETVVLAAGAALTTLGAVALVMNGIATIQWLLHRSGSRMVVRVLFWVSIFVFSALLLPVIVAMGIWDMVANRRQQTPEAGSMSGRGDGT